MPILFDEPSKREFPQGDIEDVQRTAGKALISMIPVIGAGAELLGLLTSPVEQRRTDWFEDLARRLLDVEGKVKGFSFDDLAGNQQFVSATLQATNSALRNHQKEKLQALRNAVLNVALGKEADANRQQQFIALADRFSESHLAILKFLNDPAWHFQNRGESGPHLTHVASKLLVNDLVAKGLPVMRKPQENQTATSFQFIELILGELVSLRLVTLERHHDTWVVPAFAIKPGGGPVGKMTTHLGEAFLAFITEPQIETEPR